MDGDDAVDFFKRFQSEFQVQLNGLSRDWDHYFSSEGELSPRLQGVLLVVGPSAIAAIVLIEVFPVIPDWLWFLITFVTWFLVLSLWTKWRNKGEKSKRPDISLRDLIDAARIGHWAKQVPEEARKSRILSYP